MTEAAAAPVVRLQLKDITKRFPGLTANDRISLSVNRGEIHGLLGENGAGKTTLMNVLYGLYHADEGEIILDGRLVRIASPRQAIAHGIGMVHQHFMLVPTLSVAENIILGMRALSAPLTDLKTVEQDIAAVARKYGLKIDPAALVGGLTVGEQQRVEIVKALYRGADLLILDEPTAVLTPQETQELFATLKELTHQGMSIIFITHKLNEVMAVADRVSVLRDGRLIATVPTGQTNQHELAHMMVGREVSLTVNKTALAAGRPALEVEGLTVKDNKGQTLLANVSLHVCCNEILGIAGVDGNGQRELAHAITGLLRPSSGRISLNGREITGQSPHQIMAAGVRYIPEDRLAMGLVPDFSVADNFILKGYDSQPFTRSGLLRPRSVLAHARRLVQAFDVRTRSVHTMVAQLSGGNQQKIVVGRELDAKPALLVAMQPTRGLDVGATEYIHQLLLAQRANGGAILLISTELEEVMELSDRIAVIYEGRIVGELPGGRANVQKIGLMMAGMKME
jgi:simple sugar transport system ATP-binding protein